MSALALTLAGQIARDIAERCGRDLEWSTLEAVPVLRVIAESLDGSDAYEPLMTAISNIEHQAKVAIEAMEEEKAA